VSINFITRAGGPASRVSHTVPMDYESSALSKRALEALLRAAFYPNRDSAHPMLKGSERP
jgi:hypothetical protein